MKEKFETTTLGSGCFWCIEAVFKRLNGVDSVISGYTGGTIKNPTYREVCSGTTGHAEVAQIKFNPSIISFTDILEVFFQSHDPTTLNRQGNDIGTQYRSSIFYHTENQLEISNKVISYFNKKNSFGRPVVTTIEPIETFYEAEEYHQNYFDNNKSQPYCQFIIKPKIEKLEKLLNKK